MLKIPEDVLDKIESHFHAVIRGSIAARYIESDGLTLPRLRPLLSAERPFARWQVPSMFGVFIYWIEGDGPNAKLVSEHSSRIWGGSGRRHEITAEGSRLVAHGFDYG